MKTNLLNLKWAFIFVLAIFAVSCNDSNDTTDDATADEYAEEVVFRTQESTNLGRFGCYELVFPVTISFPDASTVEVESYEAFRIAVKEWRKDNPRVRTRPSIAFPYDIISSEGEAITVDDEAEQKALRIACAKNFFSTNDPKGHNGRDKMCFKINFPFSVSLPDSTVITLNSKEDRKLLHAAIKAFKEANPDVRVHPKLVYPITVTMKDGTVVTVNNREELVALKKSCD